jgi:hypothetical protein
MKVLEILVCMHNPNQYPQTLMNVLKVLTSVVKMLTVLTLEVLTPVSAKGDTMEMDSIV